MPSLERRNKRLLTDNAVTVKKIARKLSDLVDKETEDRNDNILNDLLQVDMHKMSNLLF